MLTKFWPASSWAQSRIWLRSLPTEVSPHALTVWVVLFQHLFNILNEESVNCLLKKSNLYEDRLLNWNRINSAICFNYFQQAFYLVTPTMKSLAKGNNQTAICKLLRVLIQTSTGMKNVDDDVDDECVRDVVDVIERDPGVDGQLDRSGAMVVSHDSAQD